MTERGPLNAITDVAGVRVGHVTLVEGVRTRTGATAILPHGGNLFTDKVPAGVAVLNGYGKAAGLSQVAELGELETPILLSNTLAVGRGIEALIAHSLAQAPHAVSVNPVVGETNDSRLNDIRAARPTVQEMLRAIETASEGPVAQGCVGAGTGTVAFGVKGGIGTSSRRVGGYMLGVLVQANFGGRFVSEQHRCSNQTTHDADGSIWIIIATDAPLCPRNLTRLATRSFGGLARTGAALSNGSGDYALAFTTANRLTPDRRAAEREDRVLPNDLCSPLFEAVIHATEEAIRNALRFATPMSGWDAARNRASHVGIMP